MSAEFEAWHTANLHANSVARAIADDVSANHAAGHSYYYVLGVSVARYRAAALAEAEALAAYRASECGAA